MAEKLLMIALSPTMEQGTIVEWLRKEGQDVAIGDVICTVETDKATMDYESAQEGKLLAILKPEGSQAAVGETIAVIGAEGEDISNLIEQPKAGKDEGGTRPDTERGKAAPLETSGTVVREKAERETSAGMPERREREAAREAPQPAPARRNGRQSAPGAGISAEYHTPGEIKASPLARKIARRRGIEIAMVRGTGPGGRIVKEDVENYTPGAAAARPASSDADAQAAAAGMQALEEKRIPLGGKRAVIARRLSESKYTAPHYYLTKAVFMDEIFRARESLNKRAKEKTGLNAFIMKLAASALVRNPAVNSSWGEDEIIRHGSVDIGVAVALPDGLIVPVVRNCERKGILQIDAELRVLVEKARTNRLMPEEFSGATFTISNLGNFGIDQFTAIINPPGAAILALGTAKKEPVVDENDTITIRQVMRMTLSCDHRIIDGAVGAAFMAELAAMMENPMAALY